MTELRFADDQSYTDFATLVARARAADPDGAMRLQAGGATLAAYVGVLPGRGLMSEGAVIGLRVMPLAETVDPDLDVTVPLAALTDRLARRNSRPALSVPPAAVSTGWAAVAPPRSGWEPVGAVPAGDLERVARDGIAEIAQGTAESAGGHAVAAFRRQVWGRLAETIPPVPAGGAFAAYVLGFLVPTEECRVLANGRWTRVSTSRGHVLIR